MEAPRASPRSSAKADKEDIRQYLEKPALVLHSEDIFGKEGKLVIIKHADSFYRLMVTRQDKLILTK